MDLQNREYQRIFGGIATVAPPSAFGKSLNIKSFVSYTTHRFDHFPFTDFHQIGHEHVNRSAHPFGVNFETLPFGVAFSQKTANRSLWGTLRIQTLQQRDTRIERSWDSFCPVEELARRWLFLVSFFQESTSFELLTSRS